MYMHTRHHTLIQKQMEIGIIICLNKSLKSQFVYVKYTVIYYTTSITNVQHYEENERKMEDEIGTMQEQSVSVFLKGIDYKDTDSSLGIQLNQMLNKYNLRKTRLEQREKEVNTFLSNRDTIHILSIYCNLIIKFCFI